jgi:SHS2 domain-containing protein
MSPSPPLPRWEQFAHGADMGVRGLGRTKAEAFEQAAEALAAVVVDDPGALGTTCVTPISLASDDDGVLLVDWLNEIVYAMAVERCVFGRFRVSIEGSRLEGEAIGEPIATAREAPAVEVKGATYTALKVERGDDGTWLAQCVVDV